MADSALDILSLADAKSELRLPADHVSQDALLTSLIAQAVSFVSSDAALPLLDRAETVWPSWPREKSPMRIPVRHVRSVTSISYWEPDQALSADPAGTVVEADWGRSVFETGYALVYHSDVWPAALPGSNAKVAVVIGADCPEAVKSAVVLWFRFLHSGKDSLPDRNAYERVISPFRRTLPYVSGL